MRGTATCSHTRPSSRAYDVRSCCVVLVAEHAGALALVLLSARPHRPALPGRRGRAAVPRLSSRRGWTSRRRRPRATGSSGLRLLPPPVLIHLGDERLDGRLRGRRDGLLGRGCGCRGNRGRGGRRRRSRCRRGGRGRSRGGCRRSRAGSCGLRGSDRRRGAGGGGSDRERRRRPRDGRAASRGRRGGTGLRHRAARRRRAQGCRRRRRDADHRDCVGRPLGDRNRTSLGHRVDENQFRKGHRGGPAEYSERYRERARTSQSHGTPPPCRNTPTGTYRQRFGELKGE